MSTSQFEGAVLETIRSYWRIKAALAVYHKYAKSPEMKSNRVYYTEIPQHGIVINFIAEETLEQALNQITDYSSRRLAKDVFLALISHLEELFSNFLVSRGQPPQGTFGHLQKSVQRLHHIPNHIIEELDEIRERRNCIIHHAGAVQPRYTNAALQVFSRSGGWVADPSTVTNLDVSSGYLSYAGDVIIRYARCLPGH